MNMIDGILIELSYEAANARKMLGRVPADRLAWKPHEKSMTLGRLASHIVDSLGWVQTILEQEELVIDMEGYTPSEFGSAPELLEAFDERLAEAKAAMQGQSDEYLMRSWRLRSGDRVFFELPRVAVLRSMVLSHIVHHRGQLSVYLRLLDVPLPAVYGPSADEEPQM